MENYWLTVVLLSFFIALC